MLMFISHIRAVSLMLRGHS